MADKDKETIQSLPDKKISPADADKVKGGRMAAESEQCKETSDSGTTGCPG
jgi:hypothetical protein